MNKQRSFSLIICVTLSVLGLAALMTFVADTHPAGAARALSLTVTNANDDGPGSLRQAIADAGPGDSIDFALAYPATITLTSGELLITRPLTITGPGPELLAVSGNYTSQVFRVDDPAGADQIAVTLSGLTIRDGRGGYQWNGAGLWNDENLTLTDVIFSGNWAEAKGGGMFNRSYGSVMLTGVTFSDNGANWAGGGMYNWYHSSPTLNGVTFSGNSARRYAGAMYNADYSSPTLIDVTFIGNAMQTDEIYGGGGAMYNADYSSPTLNGVTFSGNRAGFGRGGGIFNYYSNPSLTDVIFSDNTADLDGGGIHNHRSSPTLTNVIFVGNSAPSGGGIYNNDTSSPTLTNVTFNGNSAEASGGGMTNSRDSSPTLTNVTFSSNSARYGGGMFTWNSHTLLTNVTFNGNLAYKRGGGMENRDSSATIRNSVLWGNRAAAGSDQIYNSESTLSIAYSDVQGSGGSGPGWDPGLGSDLGGNLDADPRFVSAVRPGIAFPPTGNLRLRWDSPAVDAGDNSLVPPGVTTDLEGAPRFAYGTVDMGAYELQPGLYLYKDADLAGAVPGQRLTYTLQAANTFTATAMTGGQISDTLPAGLVFAGPIALDPPGAGVVGAAPPILVSNLTLSPAQIVTITFPVTVTPGLAAFTILTNSAAVTSSQVLTPQLASHTIVVVGYYYLPVIFRSSEP